MENTTEPQIKEKKMRLWNPCSTVIDHEIDDKDKNNISIELMRKIRAIENNKQFVPDSNKDSLLRKSYEPKTLDLFNKHDILTIFKSIKCENMRRQSFFFLEYYRNEMKNY